MNIPDLSFYLNDFLVTPFYGGLILAVIFSSFSFWQKLKEDYPEEEIFTLSLLVFASGGIFSLVFYRLFGFLALGAFLGATLALYVRLRLGRKNIWEGFEALTFAWPYFAFFGGFGLFLTDTDYLKLAYPGAGLLGWLWYRWLKKKYRSFGWYKSGKLGFLFWAESVFFFALASGLAFYKCNTLYCSEGLVWLLLFITGLVMIYLRSERSAREDLKSIKKIFKKI